MVSGNGKTSLSEGSYQQLDLMFTSLEAGNLGDFVGAKYLITYLGEKGFDLEGYTTRFGNIESSLIRKVEQGDSDAATRLLLIADQLEQRLDGAYSGDITRYRRAARIMSTS